MSQHEITELRESLNALRDQIHSLEITIRERLTVLETSTRPMLEERHEQQSENRQGWKSFLWYLAASATIGAVTALGIVKSSGG